MYISATQMHWHHVEMVLQKQTEDSIVVFPNLKRNQPFNTLHMSNESSQMSEMQPLLEFYDCESDREEHQIEW